MDREFAWMLGFLLSDGSITRPTYRKKGNENHLQWQIKATDDNVLLKIKDILGTKAEIRYYEPYETMTGSSFCKLRVYDRKDIIRDYDDIKTKVPDIPTILTRHFMRGLVDGDGTIHVRKNRNNSPRFRMINQVYEIIEWFSQTLSDLLEIPYKEPRWRHQDNLWEIEWEGRVAKLIAWFLYHGDIENCCLDRKKEYYLERFVKGRDLNPLQEFIQCMEFSIKFDKISPQVPSKASLEWVKRTKKVLDLSNATPVPVNKGKTKYFELHLPENLSIVNTQSSPYWG